MEDKKEFIEQAEDETVKNIDSQETEDETVKNIVDNEDIDDKDDIKKFSQKELGKLLSETRKKERARFEKLLNESDLSEDIKEREKTISIRERKFEVIRQLDKNNLPLKLADYIDYTNDKTVERTYKELTDMLTEYKKPVVWGGEPDNPDVGHVSIDYQVDKIFKGR